MNKKSISTLFVAGIMSVTFSQSFAAASKIQDNFSGFYTGVSLGVNLNSISNKMTKLRYYDPTFQRTTDANYASDEIKSSAAPVAFQVEGGWGKVFHQKFYYGGFAGIQSANFSKVTSKNSSLVYSPQSGTTNDFTATNTFTTKQTSPSYMLGAKFGYLLSPKALLWAGLGVSQASFKLSASSHYNGVVTGENYVINQTSTPASFSKSESDVGISYAIGLEYHLLPRWSGFISDTFTNYKSLDLNGTTTVTVTAPGGDPIPSYVDLNEKVSMFTQNIMLGTVYRF